MKEQARNAVSRFAGKKVLGEHTRPMEQCEISHSVRHEINKLEGRNANRQTDEATAKDPKKK